MKKIVIASIFIGLFCLISSGCNTEPPNISALQTESSTGTPTTPPIATPVDTPTEIPTVTSPPVSTASLAPTPSNVPPASSSSNQAVKYEYDVYKRDDSSTASDGYGNVDKSTVIAHAAVDGDKQDGIDEYTIQQLNVGATYSVDIIGAQSSNGYDYTMKLFSADGKVLQTIQHISTCCGFDTSYGFQGGYYAVDFIDVNSDGYADMQVYTGGTMNETHDWYTWNSSFKTFQKVTLVGSEMLSFVTIHDNYIENDIRESAGSVYVQKLTWNGNSLIKVSEVYTTASNSEDDLGD